MATDRKRFPFYGWCVWVDPADYIASNYWQYEETTDDGYDILYDPSNNHYGYTRLDQLD